MNDEPDHSAPRKRDLRDYLPVVAQVLGIASIAVGFGMLSFWAGLAVGGVGMLAAGTVAEVERVRSER